MQNKIKLIDVHELKKHREENPHLLLIDVRELAEWQETHIPWAKHISKGELPQKIESICPERSAPIYLHCKSGTRSHHAGLGLLEQGYQHVYSITGGIIDWVKSNYEHRSDHSSKPVE